MKNIKDKNKSNYWQFWAMLIIMSIVFNTIFVLVRSCYDNDVKQEDTIEKFDAK